MTYICFADYQTGLKLKAWLAGSQAWLDGPEGGMDYVRTFVGKISPFYRTSQRNIWANNEKQGKGTADHLMPLGNGFPSFTIS